MIKYSKGKTKTYGDLCEDFKDAIFQKVCDNLDSLLNGGTLPANQISFFRWLKQYSYKRVSNIITGDPKVLQDIVEFIDKKVSNGNFQPLVHAPNGHKTSTAFGKNIMEVFDFDKLRKHFVDLLYDELDIPVCPYCNRIYTTAVKTKKNKGNVTISSLFSLDHYYSQLYFPYMSISFYNLIPSCTGCNSNFKHTNNFSIKTHLHPYLDSFNDYLKFTYFIRKSDFLKRKDNQFLIKIVPKEGTHYLGKTNMDRALRSSKDLFIEEIYNTNKDYVFEILQKAEIYTPTYLNMLYNNFFSKLGITKYEFYRLILCNYITDDELHKRPLAKLTKDIAKQTGIL